MIRSPFAYRFAAFMAMAISSFTARAEESYPILFLTPAKAGDA